jgi:hypothetical protein
MSKEFEEGKDEGTEPKTEPKIPQEWAAIPIQDYFDKGFKPYKRIKGERAYISLKRGRYEKGLGPYTDEKWSILVSMYPHKLDERNEGDYLSRVPPAPVPNSRFKTRGNLLSVGLAPPPSLPRQMGINTRTLMYYEWAKSKGFDGPLGEFLNDVCYAYFLEHGIEPVIVVTQKEENEHVGN